MRTFALPVVSWLACLLLACSADKGQGSESGGGRAGSGGFGVGGASNDPNNVPVETNNGGASSASGTATRLTAEQTPDGLLAITPKQASSILADPATSCAGWAEEPEAAASVVEFMVDVSGSMTKTTASTGTLSKWMVTQNALHRAIDDLPSSLPVGLTFFPNMRVNASSVPRPTSACVNTSNDVSIAPLSDTQRSLLTSTVDAMRANSEGATPTHDAYTIALGDIRANNDPGQKYLVIITDGQPTQSLGCVGTGRTDAPVPAQPVIDAIAMARQVDNVKTFIVGSPGSEENVSTHADVRDWLSAAARAGGTDTTGCSDAGPKYCHFDLSQATDFGTALSDALGAISRSVVSCDYAVPAPPANETIDTNLVNMIYEDGAGAYSLVLPSGAAVCEKGWHFTDETLTQIHVCASTCSLLQRNPNARISLVFGCAQDQIEPLIQ